jgi:hypothetical protein
MPDLVSPAPGAEGYWMKRRDFQMGPGVSLGVQFHFNNSIYIFSRTNVSVDLFRWHQVKYIDDTPTDNSRSEVEFALSWEVKPVLGIGIKF